MSEFHAILTSFSNTTVKIFKALQKLCNHLTKEESAVASEEIFDAVETPEPQIQEPEEILTEHEPTMKFESQPVSYVREWALKKIDLLHEADRHRNARALAAEFEEWINVPDDVEEIDYLCIEDPDWIDEQEIDTK